jgi:GntR family transcriptional regulator, N-acetylglucosamine utilization regulator
MHKGMLPTVIYCVGMFTPGPVPVQRTIDRTSPVPYYHQLKVVLRSMVESGELHPGDPLPGELRLCTQYDVSRTVVRQALIELEFEGLVDRQKGRGTFVTLPKTAQGLVQSLSGQYEDLAQRGLHLRSEVRLLELVPATPAVASHMNLAEGEPVVLLERLRLVDDEPWVLALTYLPATTLADLQKADLENGSLYAVMERMGIRPVHGRRTIEAREAGETVARDLGLRRTSPVLLLTSKGMDAAGHPVEYFEAFHRGDRSRFEVDLVRSYAVVPGGRSEEAPSTTFDHVNM